MTAPYKIAVAAAATLLLVVLASLLRQTPQEAPGLGGPATDPAIVDGRPAPNANLPYSLTDPSGPSASNRPAPALPFGDPTRGPAGSMPATPATPVDPARIEYTDTPRVETFDVGRTAFDERGKPRPSLFDPQPGATTPGIPLGPGDLVPPPTVPTATSVGTPAPAHTAPQRTTTTLTHTVQSGDSLSSIALELYGSGTHWIQIAQSNPLVDPDRLKTGQVIKLPGPPGTPPTIPPAATPDRVQTPDLGAGTQYTVKENDTLSGIAKQFYNAASKWQLIYQANRQSIGSDPGRMKPGTVLVIPPSDTGAR